jgi:hypothetical protein
MEREGWYHCEKCRKRLIKRLNNGLFHFAFGNIKQPDGSLMFQEPRVEMFIVGDIKIRCFGKGCDHWNVFTFFPNPVDLKPINNPEGTQIVREMSKEEIKNG